MNSKVLLINQQETLVEMNTQQTMKSIVHPKNLVIVQNALLKETIYMHLQIMRKIQKIMKN